MAAAASSAASAAEPAMRAPDKTKLVLVGPSKSGKSAIANLMGGLTDTLELGGLEPTAGCRIVEIERDVPGRGLLAAEVWDVAGDPRYESCWPAARKDASGCILCFNANDAGQVHALDMWCTAFIIQAKLPKSKCLILANYGSSATAKPEMPHKLRGIPVVACNLDTPAAIRSGLDDLLSRI